MASYNKKKPTMTQSKKLILTAKKKMVEKKKPISVSY